MADEIRDATLQQLFNLMAKDPVQWLIAKTFSGEADILRLYSKSSGSGSSAIRPDVVKMLKRMFTGLNDQQFAWLSDNIPWTMELNSRLRATSE